MAEEEEEPPSPEPVVLNASRAEAAEGAVDGATEVAKQEAPSVAASAVGGCGEASPLLHPSRDASTSPQGAPQDGATADAVVLAGEKDEAETDDATRVEAQERAASAQPGSASPPGTPAAVPQSGGPAAVPQRGGASATEQVALRDSGTERGEASAETAGHSAAEGGGVREPGSGDVDCDVDGDVDGDVGDVDGVSDAENGGAGGTATNGEVAGGAADGGDAVTNGEASRLAPYLALLAPAERLRALSHLESYRDRQARARLRACARALRGVGDKGAVRARLSRVARAAGCARLLQPDVPSPHRGT